MDKKVLLALASSPSSESRLRLGTEFQDMNTQLRLGVHRDNFELKMEFAVRFDIMDRAITQHRPYIVHFSGHGTGSDGLCLEDDGGKTDLMSNNTLLALFSSNQPECVILNACLSSEQAEVLAGRVKYVIGMSSAISDSAAKRFSEGFYRTLGEGGDIIKSFKSGANAVQHHFPNETNTPCMWHDGLMTCLPNKKKLRA